MIEIILDSFHSLFRSVDMLLKNKDLSLGAILAGLSPFFALWVKISREKEKKVKAALVERRQLQIAFNVNEIMEALKVESKWSLQEIGSTHTVQTNLKRWLPGYLKGITARKLNYQRRKKKMSISRKLLMSIFGAVILVLNQQLGWNLDTESIISAGSLIISYVIGQAIVDTNGIGQYAPLLEKLKSKKLWAALVGSIFIVFNDTYNWGMSSESIYMLAGTVVTFIISKSAVSFTKVKNGGVEYAKRQIDDSTHI